jgi:hypothetical protein
MIMFLYPRIIGYITFWTFNKAHASTYSSIAKYIGDTQEEIAVSAEFKSGYLAATAGQRIIMSEKVGNDPRLFFSKMIQSRRYGEMTYTVVAPAGALEAVLLVALECMRFADETPGYKVLGGMAEMPNFAAVLKGLLCALAVIFCGVFAILEYLIAFLEFMLVSSVGIILFPLSIWEGSKFMSEKFIGAIIGFFVKLLFCNICIFLMLYGFTSLAKGYTGKPFTGQVDQIITLLFTSLMFFYICKSAPGLAQSLLTGTPSLSASGAISAVGGAVAGAAGAVGFAKAAGGTLAGGAAKAAFAGAGAFTQASGAAFAAEAAGGGTGAKASAFMGSLGHSAGEALKASGGDLARSLIGGHGNGSRGSAGAGINRHSQFQKFLEEKNADGTIKTFGEHLASREKAGTDAGVDYMAKKEAKRNKK